MISDQNSVNSVNSVGVPHQQLTARQRSNIVRGRSRVTARRRPRPNRSRVSPALPDVFSIAALKPTKITNHTLGKTTVTVHLAITDHPWARTGCHWISRTARLKIKGRCSKKNIKQLNRISIWASYNLTTVNRSNTLCGHEIIHNASQIIDM